MASPPKQIAATATDRTLGMQSGYSALSQGVPAATEYATTLNTLLTKPDERPSKVYNGERAWARLTFVLETPGPVSVSHSAGVALDDGSGISLRQFVPLSFIVGRTTSIYLVSGAASRVQMIVEPIAWGEQITASIMKGKTP